MLRGLLAAFILSLAGCKWVLLNPSGDIARQQSDLLITSTWLMLLIVVPVIGVSLWFVGSKGLPVHHIATRWVSRSTQDANVSDAVLIPSSLLKPDQQRELYVWNAWVGLRITSNGWEFSQSNAVRIRL